MGQFVPDDWTEVQSQLRAAVTTDRSLHSVSISFALGLFLVALPNFGVSLLVLAAIGYRVPWADSRALSAAAMILNPLVKGPIYVVSFLVGSALFGPVPGGFSGISLEIGRHVLGRLLVGNLVVAATVAVIGYVALRYSIGGVRRLGS
jgi:uncharacterized protein (DUF2062 family)